MNREQLSTQNLETLAADPLALAIVGSLLLLYAVAWCRIFGRAGYNWAVGLLMLVPVVNIVMFFLLGFGAWPAHAELRRLRKLDDAVATAQQRYSRAA